MSIRRRRFGWDVLSRIHYDMEHTDGVLELRRIIVERLQKADGRDGQTGERALVDAIYEVVVGANATMLHALLGIPLKSLGTAPYGGVCTRDGLLFWQRSWALRSMTRHACTVFLRFPPSIGGDIVSGVLASQLDRAEDASCLLVDIGADGEIVLSQERKDVFLLSVPAGPALEGMNISCGMRAEPGAVEHDSRWVMKGYS